MLGSRPHKSLELKEIRGSRLDGPARAHGTFSPSSPRQTEQANRQRRSMGGSQPDCRRRTGAAPLRPERRALSAAGWAAALLMALVPLGSARAAEGEEPPHAVFVQESNGFPGAERSGGLARQDVAVVGGKLRILDREHAWALFVDLDQRKVREADVSAQEYVERPFEHYTKYREQREQNLENQRAEFVRMRERVEDEPADLRKLIDAYRRAGGDPDHPGRIVARLQHYPQDQKKVPLWVDGVEREVTLEHYVIRENQADVPVFDLWVTRDVELPVDLLRFYRELGTFSEAVSKRLQEIEGTIVGCTAVLDTGTLKRTFRTRVLEIRNEAPSGSMVVPASWTKVDPDAKPADAPKVSCAVCQKAIDPKAAVTFREPWGERRIHYLCSAKHRQDLVRRLADERKSK